MAKRLTVLTSNVLCLHIVVYLHYEARSLWKIQPIYCLLLLLTINIDIIQQHLCYTASRLQCLMYLEG